MTGAAFSIEPHIYSTYSFVAVNGSEFNVCRVWHVETSPKVSSTYSSARAHTHDRIKGDWTTNLNEGKSLQVSRCQLNGPANQHD